MAAGKLFLTLVLVLCFGQNCDTFLRFCYYLNWTHYRTNEAKFGVADIDPNLCTHLIFAFAKINSETSSLEISDPSDEGPDGQYKQFTGLKDANPKLKTVLSVGGEGYNEQFHTVSSTDTTRETFANNVAKYLRDHNFDGIDLDWEFPMDYAAEFDSLLKAFRKAFDAENSDPDKRLLLTVAVSPGKWTIDPSYNIPQMSEYIDYALVMSYNYHSPSSGITAFNSPLYSHTDLKFDPTLSTNWTAHYYNEKGMPFSKMVIGITGVGLRFTLANPSNTDVGALTTRQEEFGPLYGIPNGLAYPEICEVLKKADTQTFRSEEQGNPYLVDGSTWVGYDDPQSIQEKLNWTMSLDIAGVMFWSLDQDDFSGNACGEGKFPLLSKIKSETDNSDAAVGNWHGSYNVLLMIFMACVSAALKHSD